MTSFLRRNFFITNGNVSYNGKFVAKFKYNCGSAKSFVYFLTENFTVKEYFDRIEAGETPIAIVESKGYLFPHVKRWLKRDGYEVSLDGYHKYKKEKEIA